MIEKKKAARPRKRQEPGHSAADYRHEVSVILRLEEQGEWSLAEYLWDDLDARFHFRSALEAAGRKLLKGTYPRCSTKRSTGVHGVLEKMGEKVIQRRRPKFAMGGR